MNFRISPGEKWVPWERRRPGGEFLAFEGDQTPNLWTEASFRLMKQSEKERAARIGARC